MVNKISSSEIKNIQNNIKLLEKWISVHGFKGFDPYDIKDQVIVRKITELGNKNFFVEIIRETLFELFLIFPKLSRKVFGIKPSINAKGMGLLARAYLDLYKIENNEKYFDKSKECIEWLNNNYSKNYAGKGWGYPFNWQSKKLIPKNTPNGIVTTTVGDAYWEFYKFTGEEKYLKICTDICIFLSECLPINIINENQICFSYTPIYNNHVHNLNLFIAEFLLKVGLEINNLLWIELAEKAISYTISNQIEDGSFDYNGPPDILRNFKDNYHTAFVMRMLYSVYKLTNNQRYYISLKTCYNYYVKNFFENGTIPKFTPEKKYRIDIHSCAESINCLSEISSLFPEGIDIAIKVAEWTEKTLQDKSGYYYHGIFRSRITKIIFRSKISYIRWNQAWMMKGLTNLYKTLSENAKIT